MLKNITGIFPIETSQLIIKRTTIEDVDLLLKMDKQEITQLYLGGIKNKTKAERKNFLDKKINNNNLESFTVCLKDNTKIGFIELKIKEENSGEISYIFDYDYCNKGYCKEACRKILYITFNTLKLDKVYANTSEYNIKSKRVLEKLGFKSKGLNKNTNFIDYEISIEEFKQLY